LTVSAAGLPLVRGDLGSAGPDASSSLCMSTLLQQHTGRAGLFPAVHAAVRVAVLSLCGPKVFVMLQRHAAHSVVQVACDCTHCRFVSTSLSFSSTVSALTASAPKLASPISPAERDVLLPEADLTWQQGKRQLLHGVQHSYNT
jgi:hypothetical protein